MKLRTQLLLAGAVTLLLPLVAYHTVQQMDVALRDSRAFELSKSTDSVRALLKHSDYLSQIDSALPKHAPQDLYAESIRRRIVLDGYGDDWEIQRLPERRFTFADNKSTAVHTGGERLPRFGIRLAASENHLHLLLSVSDLNVAYHQPKIESGGSEFSAPVYDPRPESIASGDFVTIFSSDAQGKLNETIFRATAPGPVVGRRYGLPHEGIRPIVKVHRFRGYWAATNTGYQLEVSLPLPDVNSGFGLAIIDQNGVETLTPLEAWIGSVDPADTRNIGRLVYASREIEALFSEVVPKGSRARVYDSHGHLRADLNRLYQRPANPALLYPARTHFFNALLYRFFEWVITAQREQPGVGYPLENAYQMRMSELAPSDTDEASVKRYISQDNDRVMGSLVRLDSTQHTEMFLLFETNEDTANAFTSSAMVRMFSLVTLIGLLVAASLFAYATWLSWRIRRLSLQAKSAVGGDGRFHRAIKGSAASDEIGEMSRSFAQLVERSAGYTQYLESLASKLSHELRTPLSVVQTSLENIDVSEINESDARLLDRAQGGAAQLSVLIKSMSEAARLEQTVQRSEFVRFDAVSWLKNVRGAYSDVYQQNLFVCSLDNVTDKQLVAVPELLQQALDKLISNAVDFTQADDEISIVASNDTQVFDISVINRGAQLDESRITQLFEPMFSQRQSQPQLQAQPQTTTQFGTQHNAQPGEAHLGLGLYIVRLIAEAHGGRVYAKNLVQDNAVQIGFTVLRRRLPRSAKYADHR